MLLTDRRRLFGRREDDEGRDASQGALFAPDALSPPASRPPGPTPDPFAPPRAPAAPRAEDPDDVAAELEPAPTRVPAVLAGPTLDDVMSRAWEGLRAEVPTPCPVCHTEIEPSAHGRCGACGSTLA